MKTPQVPALPGMTPLGIKPRSWLTNSPEHTKQLKAADDARLAARNAAQNLPLAQKIEAYRRSDAEHAAAYEAVRKAVRS
jgi:hypothetical protein